MARTLLAAAAVAALIATAGSASNAAAQAGGYWGFWGDHHRPACPLNYYFACRRGPLGYRQCACWPYWTQRR
jgi:hypothetical protein